MGHLKLATYSLPHVKLARIALPRLVIGSRDDDEHEEHYHDRSAARSHEPVSVMADVHKRMEYPPDTWQAYADKPGGMMSVVEMEYRELMTAKGDGSKSGIEKELTDLAAACICALEKMKSM